MSKDIHRPARKKIDKDVAARFSKAQDSLAEMQREIAPYYSHKRMVPLSTRGLWVDDDEYSKSLSPGQMSDDILTDSTPSP